VRHRLFTNVAVDSEGNPWWEGLSKEPPKDGLVSWRECGPKGVGSASAALHPTLLLRIDGSRTPCHIPYPLHPPNSTAVRIPASAVRKPWFPGCGEDAAHANSRFTAPAAQCPTIDPTWEGA
jgi:GTP-dependent phosphoenolpyruvate carboxykinase